MKSWIVAMCAVGLWASATLPASAAWDNVFQPTLFGRCRHKQPVVANYGVAVATPVCNTCNSPPPAQSACSTSYTQRCYYQPVTTYSTQTYYEPVTTYRTSYYYEPVCSYRYSCYYDPCTCSYQQVATPVTSYQLRAQSCPVQSYVQRCCQVPVQSYQKVCYWQPQTTCCTTTEGAPIYAPAAPAAAPATHAMPPAVSAGPVPNPPSVSAGPIPNPPAVSAGPIPNPQTAAPPSIHAAPSITPAPPTPPSISESRTPGTGTSMYDRYYPRPQSLPTQTPPAMPPASWQPQSTPFAAPAPPPPPVKLERIVVGPDARIEGRVVRNDDSPRSNARVLFVNSALGTRQTAVTNSSGRFDVELPSGSWLVYLYGPDDIARYHSRVDVGVNQPVQVTLVNR
jgi:hypothetical protein